MHRRQAISLLGGAAASSGLVQAAPWARDLFPGVYKLVTYQRTMEDGKVIDVYGPDGPGGKIAYHKSGQMSAFVLRAGRKAPPPLDVGKATADELRAALRQAQGGYGGFLAYNGTYDVDEAKKTVIHHVEEASNPVWQGTDFIRNFELSPGQITLRLPGTTIRLVWEQISDA